MSETESSEVTTEATEVPETTETESDSLDQSSEVTTEATEVPVEEKKSSIRKLKLKIDGEETEEEVDLDNLEALQRDIQLARAAKKRMAEAQEAKRKAFDLMQQFDKDPGSILKRMGAKGQEIAEQILLEKIQNEMLTPEQREFNELKQKLSRYEAMEKEQAEQAELQKQQQLERQQADHYQKVIIDALESSGLPKTPDAIKRMAYLLQKNLELGLDLDAKELALEAKKDVESYVSSIFRDADIDSVLKTLGPDLTKKLRKYDLDQLKAKQQKVTGTRAPQKPSEVRETKARSHESFDEWKARVAQNLRG